MTDLLLVLAATAGYAVGNGVPLPMGRAIAKAVKEATEAAPC